MRMIMEAVTSFCAVNHSAPYHTASQIRSAFACLKSNTRYTEISGISQTKSSVAKAVRGRLLKDYPPIEHYIDGIIAKKEPLNVVKCHEHIELLTAKGEILFFRQRDGPYMPCLKLLHKYPNLLPRLQVDKGAIKFILSGANIMAPGLTSPGARMDIDLPADTVVAIMAEGKQHALCIGITKLSTADIRSINKGIAVDNIHYLCDGLWAMKLQHR